MAVLYDGKGNVISVGDNSNNFKIIAHRGYFAKSKENTIESFVEAVANGFRWIEIDIQRCADGVYVLAHNASYTMYNNGTAVAVTFASDNYADIKNYTWDADGVYRLATLEAAFHKMRSNDVMFVCDKKSGTNADIMELANRCGAVDQVMLSYGSFSAATTEAGLLKKYPTVPIRCIPSVYADYALLVEAVANPVYADIPNNNAGAISNCLSIGIPMLYSGGSMDNAAWWQVISAGVMAWSGNIPYDTYYAAYTDVDYNVSNDITASAASIEVAVNATADLTAESTLDTPAGYVYAYSENPVIATVTQSVFGKSATATVTGKQAGSTNIVLFSGNGEEKRIPVTVA